jgi:FAD-linked sulfhydryl oxidase
MKIYFLFLSSWFILFISIKIYKNNYISKYKDYKNRILIEKKYNETLKDFYTKKNENCSSLGKHTWAVLHSIAASYSNKPNNTDKEYYKKFFNGLIHNYPSKNNIIKNIVKENPLKNSNREEFVYYICEIHNIMNKKLNKKHFRCKLAFDIWGGDCGCDS